MSSYHSLLHAKHANVARHGLFSWWVAAVPCCTSFLLMIIVLTWLFSQSVIVVPHCILNQLLTMHVLNSLACELLSYPAVVYSCCWYLFLTIQWVSNCCALLLFDCADNTCPWLFSWWVTGVLSCFNPDDNACPWLPSLWVAAAVFWASWWHLTLYL